MDEAFRFFFFVFFSKNIQALGRLSDEEGGVFLDENLGVESRKLSSYYKRFNLV